MKSTEVLECIARHESRNITQHEPSAGWPIVWERARGCSVWDPEGREYLDMTAAFGVAACGHANPRVVAAGKRQMGRLLHAMGDVHPHASKARLLRELSQRTYGRWAGLSAKGILTGSGSEAVEAAMKTARLATGRRGVVAFEGAYHGVGYGALNATHREHFRRRFADQLGGFVRFLPFPVAGDAGTGRETVPVLEGQTRLRELDRLHAEERVGAVLVEPIQARGGIRVPQAGFLSELKRWCEATGALLILDEIYTGFGRTGAWFACEWERTVPDLVCLGKGLTGGFPMGACLGRGELMDAAWPVSNGEAIHTSTFLGHPVGCAMALAQMEELEDRSLVERSRVLGCWLRGQLEALVHRIRGLELRVVGRGLMAGIEFREPGGAPAGALVVRLMQSMLRAGIIVLPEGADAEVLSFTPPLVVRKVELEKALGVLERCLEEIRS